MAVAAPSEVPNTIVQVWCFLCLIKKCLGILCGLDVFFCFFSKLGTGVFCKIFLGAGGLGVLVVVVFS